jgi:hypothetical protein
MSQGTLAALALPLEILLPRLAQFCIPRGLCKIFRKDTTFQQFHFRCQQIVYVVSLSSAEVRQPGNNARLRLETPPSASRDRLKRVLSISMCETRSQTEFDGQKSSEVNSHQTFSISRSFILNPRFSTNIVVPSASISKMPANYCGDDPDRVEQRMRKSSRIWLAQGRKSSPSEIFLIVTNVTIVRWYRPSIWVWREAIVENVEIYGTVGEKCKNLMKNREIETSWKCLWVLWTYDELFEGWRRRWYHLAASDPLNFREVNHEYREEQNGRCGKLRRKTKGTSFAILKDLKISRI